MIAHVAATLLLGMAQGTAPPLLQLAMESPVAPPVILPVPAPLGPPASIAVHARPRLTLSSLVINDDYPIEALRAEAEGTVEFMLDIGSNGLVTGCRISRTSGSAALDSTTCRLMMSRARFIPASDADGRAMPDTYAGNIVWRIDSALEQPSVALPPPPAPPAPPVRLLAPPPPPPRTSWPPRPLAPLAGLITRRDYPPMALRYRHQGTVGYRVTVAVNGRVGNCVVTSSSGSTFLDAATCRLIISRARFAPGRDLEGRPVVGTVSGRTVWRIDAQQQPPPGGWPEVRIPSPPPAPPPPAAPPGGWPAPVGGRAQARAALPTLISDEDYPPSALRANEQGTVRFTLEVGPNGRVTDCIVTGSSNSATLDSATCRIMRSRARFIPARDSAGNPTADRHVGRVIWKIERPYNQPFAPFMMVEEMRSDAAGALSCWSSFNAGPPEPKPCKAEENGAQLAALARSQRMSLALSTVMTLTPEGAAAPADSVARGDLFRSSDAALTIAADGSILVCRVTSSFWLGTGNTGVPPTPCLHWYPGMRLYAAAPEGSPNRTVNVAVRGYAKHSFRKLTR